ncbi:MAG TPA: 30S ribosomal protein S11 [Anaerohalosphaeraceae bacterium]|jgi:small subunit ribosomal protein S11|nr:30S ribosomal protein S11 [Anaerohalosphaeraceae bacterium]HOL88297.1 30S ribosomal protein S11 [Anaerohalosphaeraceae bacterium]HOQ03622.1 30S ribosomal protein S11 [Anaerohalosphaeraceae bacterium]HPP56709.1 30S ribosomal protein S11 [Anaerohalosphaeraceae bacterium]
MAKSVKRKVRKNVVRGIVHITATFNNTLITVTDMDGDTICQDSGGSVGFKGSRKSTPFAAQRAAEKAARTAMRSGLREVEIRVKGPGSGRESAIAAIQQAGLRIASIEDVTPIPHNGCRPRKRRRV